MIFNNEKYNANFGKANDLHLVLSNIGEQVERELNGLRLMSRRKLMRRHIPLFLIRQFAACLLAVIHLEALLFIYPTVWLPSSQLIALPY